MKAKIKTRIQLKNREPLWENIPLSTPWVIFVDPSNICNFKCKFCPTGQYKSSRKPTIMSFTLFKKIVDDIYDFDKPIKVLRLYKDGEPLLNPSFSQMVKYGKDSGCCEKIDTTTNGYFLNPKRNLEIINAGLDRINISIEGVNSKQYLEFSNVKINFNKFVKNIEHFYENRQQCEMFIKINGDFISEKDKEKFFSIFGDICDGIAIEHTMNCWYDFETEQNNNVGVYGQPIKDVEVCPYPFYSISINSEGSVSLCFLDWDRKLLIGDVRNQSIKEIWNSQEIFQWQRIFLRKKRKKHHICGKCSQLSHGLPVDLDNHSEMLLKKIWRERIGLSNL